MPPPEDPHAAMPIAVIADKVVLFIHVPKTGGSSIEDFLAQNGRVFLQNNKGTPEFPCSAQHFHADLLDRILPATGIDFGFMLVRHPLARMVSEYRYVTRKPGRAARLLPFGLWLRLMAARVRVDPYARDNHLRPQHEFERAGTTVYRFEDGIGACLAAVAARLGLPPPASVPHLKRAAPAPVTVTPADAAFVHRLYRADYERYGYDETPVGAPGAE